MSGMKYMKCVKCMSCDMAMYVCLCNGEILPFGVCAVRVMMLM